MPDSKFNQAPKTALIKINGFRGGVPFSMYEYKKALVTCGWKVIVCGWTDSNRQNENIFLKDTDVIDFPEHNERSIKSHYILSKKLASIIIEHNVSLLLSPSRNDFTICKIASEVTEIPFIPIIPGGTFDKNAANLLEVKNGSIICFSQENKTNLISAGLDKENISVISNRISSNVDLNWKDFYKRRSGDGTYKILLVSRLDRDLSKDVMGCLDFLNKVQKLGFKIELKVAGSGKDEAMCKKEAKETYGDNSFVKFLGYVENLQEESNNADIIIGKGRSVLGPIMSNRIGFVLGKEGKISLCSNESLTNLYENNFSGRNIEYPIDCETFCEIISRIKSDDEYVSSFESVFENVRKLYDAKFLRDKLGKVIEKVEDNQTKDVYSKRKLYANTTKKVIKLNLYKLRKKL